MKPEDPAGELNFKAKVTSKRAEQGESARLSTVVDQIGGGRYRGEQQRARGACKMGACNPPACSQLRASDGAKAQGLNSW